MTDMVKALRDYRKAKIKQYPVHTNRASSLGHPCLRFLVYNRTHWAEVEPFGPDLQAIFDDGHMHEKQLIIELYQAGVEIYDQQTSLSQEPILKEANISAHLDWMLVENPKLSVPVDAKSASQYSYDAINSYEDMVNSEKVWVMQYPGQLQIYCLAKNSPYGYFFYKNKNNSQLKQIKMELDYGYAEELIQKGHEIERHLKNKTVPDRIKYNPNICDGCKHQVTCNPEIPENFSLYFMDQPKFLEKIRRWEQLESQGKEYASLDKEIKGHLKGTGKIKVVVGEFLLKCKVMSNDGQKWTRERLSISGSMSDDLPTGTCKDCNEKLDVSDSLLLGDQCTPCLEKIGRQ